jgi:cytochrome P450
VNQNRLIDAQIPPFVYPMTLTKEPHASLAVLREKHALIQLGENHYMALRAEHVLPLLTDPRTKQIEGPDYVRLNQIPEGVAKHFLADFFLFANGEAHATRRRLFARSFSNSAIRNAQADIQAVAESIVADLPRGEPFDFIERMAARLPAEMISRILGLPEADVPYLANRTYQLARSLAPIYPIAHHDAIEEAAGQLFDYVGDHMTDRLAAPQEDMLSSLLIEWSSHQSISFDSLVHQVIGIIVGGTDTTRATFAMLVGLLLEHPGQWAAVKADPALIPGAVSEAMRFDPSVASIARFTTTEVEIDGMTLPAGVVLRVSTMSAMRDPALYANPDQFDIRRTDHPRLHPVFGMGPHRCIGEMLARLAA